MADLDALRNGFVQGNLAWNRGDFEGAYRTLGDDFEYHLAPTWPRRTLLHGRAEVIEFFEEFREAFPDARTTPPEFVEVTEHRVIVGYSVSGTGQSSGARVEMEIWQVWELTEGGRPVRVDEYGSRQAALSAAGADR